MPDYTDRVRTKQADQLNGENLLGATLVYPPGSSLYKVSVRKGMGMLLGGPIGAVIQGKLENRELEGAAATIPKQWGILALTDRRLLWFEAKPGLSIGPQPKQLLLQWPLEQIERLDYEAKGLGGYPTFAITFADGSAVAAISENTHQPVNLANAWASVRPGA